jgi:hypothetical protein
VLRPNTHRYGQWAGNEKGQPEDETRCVAQVWGAGEWIGRQCRNKRGFGPDGLWCKRHAKVLEGKG